MAELISSVQNPRIKAAAKLRERRGRKQHDRIIIDGAREVRRAIEAGVAIDECFVCEDLLHSVEQRNACRIVRESVTVIDVTPAVFAKLAFGDRAEGIVAVAPTPLLSLDEIKLPSTPVVAVLESIEKPGNVGAMLRSADAAGINAVLLADAVTDLYNPNTIRASLGVVFTLPVCSTTSEAAKVWLFNQDLNIVAARVDGSIAYTDVDMKGGTAIVLGSEADGLSDVWSGDDVQAVSLPMHGTVDSLNVSTTAAVLFYETVRQRENS